MTTRLSPLTHSRSRSSLLSATTYHSFLDVELYEQRSPTTTSPSSTEPTTPSYGFPRSHSPVVVEMDRLEDHQQETFEPVKMSRQDSGYASIPSSASQTSSKKRRSLVVTTTPRSSKPRPSRRSSKTSTTTAAASRTSAHELYQTQSHQSQQQQPFTYYQFPAPPEPLSAVGDEEGRTSMSAIDPLQTYHDHLQLQRRAETPTFPAPPQTTHYWTSDRTRRLEYAAIDAASRGVRGWVMRHLVPDCFVPSQKRHVSFDDDSGSVRRYRLDLDDDEDEDPSSSAEKKAHTSGASSAKKWRFWGTGTKSS